MSKDIKVGDTLWMFDINHRVYNKNGRSGPDYEQHFRPYTVLSIESRSYVLCPRGQEGGLQKRLNKKTLSLPQGKYMPLQFYTDTDKENDVWKYKHMHKIVNLISSATVDQLKHIAAIIGYQED